MTPEGGPKCPEFGHIWESFHSLHSFPREFLSTTGETMPARPLGSPALLAGRRRARLRCAPLARAAATPLLPGEGVRRERAAAAAGQASARPHAARARPPVQGAARRVLVPAGHVRGHGHGHGWLRAGLRGRRRGLRGKAIVFGAKGCQAPCFLPLPLKAQAALKCSYHSDRVNP